MYLSDGPLVLSLAKVNIAWRVLSSCIPNKPPVVLLARLKRAYKSTDNSKSYQSMLDMTTPVYTGVAIAVIVLRYSSNLTFPTPGMLSMYPDKCHVSLVAGIDSVAPFA